MKAFFFDIDGTLLEASTGMVHPTEYTMSTLKQLKKEGHKIFIATGRPLSYIAESILEIGFDGVVASNGSYVLCEGETLYMKEIDTDFQKRILDCCDNHNIGIFLEGPRVSYYNEKKISLIQGFITRFGIDGPKVAPADFSKPMVVNKVCYIVDKTSNLEALTQCMGEEFTHMAYPGGFGGDFYYAKNSKATGIEKVINKLGIAKEDTYAFGDGDNDIEMLAYVGTGIAMGNAHDTLKEQADIVIDTVENNGVAKYLNQHILTTATNLS